jgi:transposase InsO family protein
VAHRQIPWGYPQANGKVERSHRTDEDEFYRRVLFRTPAELAQKLRQWEHESTIAGSTSRCAAGPRPSAYANFGSLQNLFKN